MAEVRSTAVIQDALRRLGFVSYVGGEGHTVYRHMPSDTIFLFHRAGPRTLTPLRVASIRRLAVGRGAATERAYDKAFAEASAAKPAWLAKPKTTAKPAKPVRRRAAGAAA